MTLPLCPWCGRPWRAHEVGEFNLTIEQRIRPVPPARLSVAELLRSGRDVRYRFEAKHGCVLTDSGEDARFELRLVTRPQRWRMFNPRSWWRWLTLPPLSVRLSVQREPEGWTDWLALPKLKEADCGRRSGARCG